MKHRLTLDYELAEGWLSPWIDGLRKGQAVASHCSACHSSRFPPLRTCPNCRAQSDTWISLSGRAEVLFRTSGADGDFVLAQFEGAEGSTVLRADHLPFGAELGRLRASIDGPPSLQLESDDTR